VSALEAEVARLRTLVEAMQAHSYKPG
jgi:hypothetical protein